MQNNQNKYAPLKLHWKVPFGKYQHLTVRELIDKDASYFSWLRTTNVKFTQEVIDYYNCDDKSTFDEKQTEKAITKTISLSQWQVIKIKPEDRNFDLKPEDFDLPNYKEEDFAHVSFIEFDLSFLD